MYVEYMIKLVENFQVKLEKTLTSFSSFNKKTHSYMSCFVERKVLTYKEKYNIK